MLGEFEELLGAKRLAAGESFAVQFLRAAFCDLKGFEEAAQRVSEFTDEDELWRAYTKCKEAGRVVAF